MMVKVYLRVKFRAFLITFGVVERTWIEPLPVPVPPKTYIDHDERGVRLLVEVV